MIQTRFVRVFHAVDILSLLTRMSKNRPFVALPRCAMTMGRCISWLAMNVIGAFIYSPSMSMRNIRDWFPNDESISQWTIFVLPGRTFKWKFFRANKVGCSLFDDRTFCISITMAKMVRFAFHSLDTKRERTPRVPSVFHLAQKLFLPTSKRCADSISNVCIMDERGKRRENGKHLVVRDANSIRFYKLWVASPPVFTCRIISDLLVTVLSFFRMFAMFMCRNLFWSASYFTPDMALCFSLAFLVLRFDCL